MAARCTYCGEALRPHSMFCLSCGQLVGQAAQAPSSPSNRDTNTTVDVPRGVSISPPPAASGPVPAPAIAPAPTPAAVPAPAVPVARDLRFTLRFSTGSSCVVDGDLLVGRKPESAAKVEGIGAIALGDDAKSVSRVHALVQVIDDQLWVTDRGSANGTHIDRDGQTTECHTLRPVAAQVGDTIWFGSVSCTILVDNAP